MSWNDIMRRMLPTVSGVVPHITSRYGDTNRPEGSSNPHGGVDFNYVGGQNELNMSHQGVRSPVDGIVVNAGAGTVGRIAIRDKNGYLHEILHTHSRHVSVGDPVVAGQLIGTMGNTGVTARKPKEPAHHVHYQLLDLTGRKIDPPAFWDAQGPVDPNPAPPALLQEYQEYLRAVDANSGDAKPMSPSKSVGSPTPAWDKDFRYVSRRTADQPKATYGDVMAPVFPPNEISAGAPTSFADRFGDWVFARGQYREVSRAARTTGASGQTIRHLQRQADARLSLPAANLGFS